jgi:serine/threonine-protein kinase
MPMIVPRDAVLAPTRVGEVIDGRWRLVARIGGGGMGEVYRAEHVSLGRVVAIKVLRPELASSAMYARRVLREGQAATLVSHPNIARIEDLGIDEKGMPYLVQEFLDGIDLATYAQYRRGPVPARDLIPLLLPILDALGVLHDAGVVHRDLKPENVFLVRDGSGWSPRLLDFGLAVIAEHLDDQPRITASDVTLGSPAYMSPEQFRDPRHLTASSDLWSIGVMLYELLCGVLPFQGQSVGAVAIAVTHEIPIPLHHRVLGISSSLAASVMACLDKDPARRPASVRSLMAVLTAVHSTLPPPIAEEDLAPTERRSAIPVSPGPAISPAPPPPPPPDHGPRPAAYVIDDPMPTMPLALVRPARPSPAPPTTATPKATEAFMLTRRAPGGAATRGRWALALLGLSMLVMLGLLAAWRRGG